MNQKQIAQKLGVTRAMISFVFSGKSGLSWNKAKRLAEILGMPVEKIMDRDVNAMAEAADKTNEETGTETNLE